LIATFALAAALTLAVACAGPPAQGATRRSDDPGLFLLGGSILARLSSNNDVDAEFDMLGWSTSHDAVGGRTIRGGLNMVRTTREADVAEAQAMVIVLGINDRRKTPSEFVAKVDELNRQIRSLNPDIGLYWVNMVAFRKTCTTQEAVRKVRILNSRLEHYAAANRIRIIDWRRIADGATDYNQTDGYHPDRSGQLKLLRLMKRSIGAAPANQARIAAPPDPRPTL